MNNHLQRYCHRGAPPLRRSRSRCYEKLLKISEGTYSEAYKCRNKETGDIVAIKKFVANTNEESILIRRIIIREVKIMKKLKHDNLINLIEVFTRNWKLHFVFEHCDHTVRSELTKHPQGFPEEQCKDVIWQTIKAVAHCHSDKSIHRDVKPENIYLAPNGVAKLCEFGFSRIIKLVHSLPYSSTRWYRAPELLVGDDYGQAVDVWAIGCVFVELLTGKTLWYGKNYLDQLYLIRVTLGELLSRHMLKFAHSKHFEGQRIPEPIAYIPLEKRLPTKYANDPVIIDFIKRCLDKDPDKRWTCEELLCHEMFKNTSLPVFTDWSET